MKIKRKSKPLRLRNFATLFLRRVCEPRFVTITQRQELAVKMNQDNTI